MADLNCKVLLYSNMGVRLKHRPLGLSRNIFRKENRKPHVCLELTVKAGGKYTTALGWIKD